MKSVAGALLAGSVRTWSAAIVLALLGWAIYGPALNRVFASDQIHYFAELNGSTSLTDGLRQYDYAATRRFWKGDDALFRPVLFAWLAVANSLFSYHHVWWNTANLAIHVLTALFLFRLLIAIRPSPFALAAAALFLVVKAPTELVLWNHLGGYMLACLFLAIGLRAFVRLVGGGPDSETMRTRAEYVAGFAAASLCHEAMTLVSGLAASLWLVTEWRRTRQLTGRSVVIAVLPLLLFVVLYGFHAQRVARLTYVDRPDAQSLFAPGNAAVLLPRSLSTIAGWTMEIAIPSATTLIPSAFGRFVKQVAFSWTSPRHVFELVLALAAIAIAASSANRRHVAGAAPLLLLVSGAMLAYAAVVCFGRAPDEVRGVAYYPYIFGFLLVILAYSLIDFSRLRPWPAAAAWLMIMVLNAAGTATVARESERINHYPSLYLNRVIRFVDAHKAAPGFSFTIEAHPQTLDPAVDLVEGYPKDPRAPIRTLRLTEILFKRYYRAAEAQYRLDASAQTAVLASP